MDIWHSFTGVVKLRAVSADLPGFLRLAEKEDIAIFKWQMLDDLTADFEVRRGDLKKLRKLAEKRGENVHLRSRSGVYWTLKRLLHRKTLIVGLTLLLALHCFISTRVLFISVEGNGDIPANLILEQAEACGIRFGASRGRARSEKMKNALLFAMPQLQWAGVNTAGSTAVISVRPRADQPDRNEDVGVTCMVAVRDGVIVSCTATSGSLLCAPGAEVKAGDKLISGYTDCGLSVRAGRSEGEVFAQTSRDLAVTAPAEFFLKSEIQRTEQKYSLIIGKKQINFYKDSGISDMTCDKMYEEKSLTLPGGFILPVKIVKETVVYYDTQAVSLTDDQLSEQLSAFARAYLLNQMIAGQIVREDFELTTGETAQMNYRSTCTEMIGRIQKEEIIIPNGNND